jgi:hypothetical protein
MNMASLFSGYIIDLIRNRVGMGNEVEQCSVSSHYALRHFSDLNSYQFIILGGAFLSFCMTFIAFFGIRDLDRQFSRVESNQEDSNKSAVQIFRSVVSDSSFWRFSLLVFLLIGVRQSFRQIDATLPKYMLRTLGCDAPFGTIASVNPLIVIFLAPASVFLAKSIPVFNQILIGSVISALSLLFLSVSQGIWASVMFLVVLSIGEVLWSPRLYEYSAIVAPKGKEGTYMALTTAPFFLAKLLAGGLSGALLQEYCPCAQSFCEPCCTRRIALGEATCPQGKNIWLITFGVTISSPILIFLCRRIILKNDDGITLDEKDTERLSVTEMSAR